MQAGEEAAVGSGASGQAPPPAQPPAWADEVSFRFAPVLAAQQPAPEQHDTSSLSLAAVEEGGPPLRVGAALARSTLDGCASGQPPAAPHRCASPPAAGQGLRRRAKSGSHSADGRQRLLSVEQGPQPAGDAAAQHSHWQNGPGPGHVTAAALPPLPVGQVRQLSMLGWRPGAESWGHGAVAGGRGRNLPASPQPSPSSALGASISPSPRQHTPGDIPTGAPRMVSGLQSPSTRLAMRLRLMPDGSSLPSHPSSPPRSQGGSPAAQRWQRAVLALSEVRSLHEAAQTLADRNVSAGGEPVALLFRMLSPPLLGPTHIAGPPKGHSFSNVSKRPE
jgi:hypothetical protein